MSSSSSIDDAEKGVADQDAVAISFTLPDNKSAPSLSADSRPSAKNHSKEVSESKTPQVVVYVPKEVVQPHKPARKPAPRKISRWIRFQLWFNTYR